MTGQVHVLAHPGEVLPQQEVGHAAALLHHLHTRGVAGLCLPPADLASRLRGRQATSFPGMTSSRYSAKVCHLFDCDQLGNIVKMLLDQLLVFEHYLLSGNKHCQDDVMISV